MFGFGKKRTLTRNAPASAREEPLPPPAPASDAHREAGGEPLADPRPAEAAAQPATPAPSPAPAPTPTPMPTPDPVTLPRRPSALAAMNERMLQKLDAAAPDSSALNSQIVQAVQLTNTETASYAPSQIATAPDMMISQAAGLVAQSAAAYFDGVSKLALASQAILLKQMTENIAADKPVQAAEDALGALATDLLMGAAAAVAAAAGALEADAAGFAIDKIDQSIARYADTLANRQGGTP